MNLLNLHIYNYWRLSLVKLGHHCLGLMVMGLWLRVYILFYFLGNFLLFFIFFFGFLSFLLYFLFWVSFFSSKRGAGPAIDNPDFYNQNLLGFSFFSCKGKSASFFFDNRNLQCVTFWCGCSYTYYITCVSYEFV